MTARLRLVVQLIVCAALVSPATAGAAPPNSSPRTIQIFGFESGQPSFTTAAFGMGAFWGPVIEIKRNGLSSLWCAGTLQGGAPGTFGTYPEGTGGNAKVDLPALGDYYASRVTFWYLMPSRGPGDRFQFSAQPLVDGRPDFTTFVSDDRAPLTSIWALRTHYLGLGANPAFGRLPMQLSFGFDDETEGDAAVTGQGPAIDDVTVAGYRFGPVRQLVSSWSTSPAGVRLEWAPPARSATDASADDRPMTYRIWRSPAGRDTWTEVATSAPVAEPSVLDTSALPAAFYDYVVQAWDPSEVDPREWGVQATPLRVATHGAIWMSALSRPPATVRYGRSFTVSGVLQPRHVSGSPVKIQAYRYYRGRIVQRVTLTAAITNAGQPYTSTKFYRYVRLPARGVWRLRAYHVAHDGERSLVSPLSTAVTVR